MRALLLALVAAAMPFALCAHAVDSPSPIPGGAAAVAADRWISLGIASASVVALFAALSIAGDSAGVAFAGALAFATFPAMADAALSPQRDALLAAAGLALAFLAVSAIAWIRGSVSPWGGPLVVGVAAGAAFLFLVDRAKGCAASAQMPAIVAWAPGAGFFAARVARTATTRGDLSRNQKVGLASCLAMVVAAAGVLSLRRVETWKDPLAFWERARSERQFDPAPIGAAAEAAFRAGDRVRALDRLRLFAEAVHRPRGGPDAPERARRIGADGAAAAAAGILETPEAGGEETAVEALRAAEAFCPTSAGTVRILGEMQLRRGDFVDAVVTLERATALDAANAGAWESLARARILAGRPADALEAALHARGLDPASKAYAVTCAEAMLAAGRDAEALEVLHAALLPLPGDPVVARAYADAHLRIARKETSAGEKGRARRRLLAGLEAVRDHEGCLELLGRLNRQYEAERPEADRLLDPGPDGSVTLDRWLRHVAWLCRWGRFDEAGAHFDDMIRRFGNLAEVHYHRGREFWEARGTVEGVRAAIDSYRAALARDPKHVESWNRLWRCLALLGNDEEAAQAARRFLEVAPEHPDGVEAELFLGIEPGDAPDSPPRPRR